MSQLARNILSQADSLAGVLDHQRGSGRECLLEAAARIRAGSRVLITGIGASMFASIPLEYYLSSCGIDAVLVEAAEFLHYRSQAFSDSVVLVISRSGESVEIARILNLLKGRQPVIGVTNEPASFLAKTADLALHMGSLPDEMVAIQTYTATLVTLYLLGSAITGSFDAAWDSVYARQSEFAHLVRTSMDSIEQWDGFLRPGLPLHLLARGPSYASALEGALLFNEIAKATAVGLPVASFRHGPAEIVDEEFRGILFAPQGPTEEMNLSLGRDLLRFGGRVGVVGPQAGSIGDDPACRTPQVPDALAPLFEIVPMQVAALRMAQLRGIAPGSFRYTPQVAVDEASFGNVSGSVK